MVLETHTENVSAFDLRTYLARELFGPDDTDVIPEVVNKIVAVLQDVSDVEFGPRPSRVFGPKDEDHPSVGTPCPACRRPFEGGDYTMLVVLGPADDEESRLRAIAGRTYNAVAVEVHAACVTGREHGA